MKNYEKYQGKKCNNSGKDCRNCE